MLNNPIIKKLQKIRALAEGARGTPEGKMAQQLLDKLMDKYEIDLNQVEPKTKHNIPYSHPLLAHIKHLAWSLYLKVYMGGPRGDVLFIGANQSELETFMYLLSHVKILFKEKKKELMRQLDSYILGFMELTYPITNDDKEPECPLCGIPLVYSHVERRYLCSCGYRGKKYPVRWIDENERNRGRGDSGRLLK